MRKHNEGYTLVLVLVVLIVLALLSTLILTGAQRNLEAQWSSVEHMQDKYQAQAEIEKVQAKLEALLANNVTEPILLKDDSAIDITVTALDKKVEAVARSGSVQVRCKWILECTSITESGVDSYQISNFTGMECTSYQISTIGGGGI